VAIGFCSSHHIHLIHIFDMHSSGIVFGLPLPVSFVSNRDVTIPNFLPIKP